LDAGVFGLFAFGNAFGATPFKIKYLCGKVVLMFTQNALEIFEQVITDYHIKDDPYQTFENPYDPKAEVLNHLLYRKCWIDTVQWHYEDIIRDPQIDPVAALTLKRQIDASNQDRTDMVEYIDSYFLEQYKEVTPKNSATIYHMRQETQRPDASAAHKTACQTKLDVLLEQRHDLSTAIEQLLKDIAAGDKYMKVYKQMKMYNDDELNPVLRGQK